MGKIKILLRKRASYKFRVLKPFSLGHGQTAQVGDELTFITPEQQADAVGLVQRGKLYPCDLPEVGKYICKIPFFISGKECKYEAKAGEIVELKAEEALQKMFTHHVKPENPNQWRPYTERKREIKHPIHEFPRKEPFVGAWKYHGHEGK